MALELEAGVDRAEMLLRHYDRDTERWDLETSGPFWDAVRLAHDMGRRGEGVMIGVVDGAFDRSYRRVAAQTEAWPSPPAGSSAHGTVVALLIMEVAPEAGLILYPCRVDGRLDEARVVDAIHDAVARGVDLVNLSMGDALPWDTVFDAGRFFDPASFWPDMTAEDRPFWTASRLGATEFRAWLRIEPSPLTEAAEAAVAAGVPVIAAAGNHLETLSVPAVCPEVIGVAFNRERRFVDEAATEIAESIAPSYTPSDFSDFAIIQPPEVLGSSFATPLLSAFAAVMRSAAELDLFRDMVRLGGLGTELMLLATAPGSVWNDRRHGTMVELYEAAVARWPHAGEAAPCPECSFFALPTFVDYGLLRLRSGDPAGARHLLHTARAVAPSNAHAAANLGVTYGALADGAVARGDVAEAREHLRGAVEHMAAAVSLRDDHPPYAERLDEFQQALTDPSTWRMRP